MAEVEDLATTIEQWDVARSLSEAARRELFDRIQHMESAGYDLGLAGGTLELLVREAANPDARPFDVTSFEVTTRMTAPDQTTSSASVSVRIHDAIYAATAKRAGPMDALDAALRQCLSPLFPAVAKVELIDYRMQVLEQQKGSAAKATVLVYWLDQGRTWSTMGVSYNMIEAGWLALVGGIRLELMRLGERDVHLLRQEDNSWAV